MDIIFFGSADFGIPALELLISNQARVRAIVTTPAKPQGRGLTPADSPVARYAQTQGLAPVFKPTDLSDPEFIGRLKELPADLYVVIAYRILPPEVFSIPALGTVNVHASLLPRYRGAAPIHRAVEAGEQTTGVTVFKIDAGIDTGKVLVQKSIAIAPYETTPQLYDRLSKLGADALAEAYTMMAANKVSVIPQEHLLATRAPKLDKKEAVLDWTLSAAVLFNKIRAFKPFPGTCTTLENKLLKIEWALPEPGNKSIIPGIVVDVAKEWFEVQCGEGCLRVLEVKPEGKKQMKVKDFLQGNNLEKGTRLG